MRSSHVPPFLPSLPPAMGKALSSLSTYAHSMSEVMLLGVATSHLASAEEGKSESENQENCALCVYNPSLVDDSSANDKQLLIPVCWYIGCVCIRM